MGTATQITEKNIVSVALANIQPSNYNPRKNFEESSLTELADSIRQQGVLQPIGVRPIAESDNFEIVFGERRYRASLMAGLDIIPVIVLNVSDETAEEMAVTENLQRKDVTPIEEANAYQRLIASGRHDVQSLAIQFGKNENYIRTRLKFVSLIPEIAQLLEQDELTISVASEICKYGEDIQTDIYEKHLTDDGFNSWRGLKATDVASKIERNYTTDLSYYQFDKTQCQSCAHNTKNMILFCEGGCGNCANRSCLMEKNNANLTAKAVQLMEQHPNMSFCFQDYDYNEDVIEQLTGMGYEVERANGYTIQYPKQPEAPQVDNFENHEEYENANNEYEQHLSDYNVRCDEINSRYEAGEVSLYIRIGRNDIFMCFMDNSKSASTTTQEQLSPVQKLEKQDKRNKEIAIEKTIEDTKKHILEVDMTERKFGADEEKMIYFFLLSFLRREHYIAVGIEDGVSCISDKEKMRIIDNLTSKQKTIIRRDFLISNFKNAYGNNTISSLLLDFAQKHMPDELAGIKNGHDETYEKRHKRIEEKKALLDQKQEKQEADNTEGCAA